MTDTPKIYEIHNPSDPYTLKAADPAAAALACLFLGEGAYVLTDEDGTSVLPFFRHGSVVKQSKTCLFTPKNWNTAQSR